MPCSANQARARCTNAVTVPARLVVEQLAVGQTAVVIDDGVKVVVAERVAPCATVLRAIAGHGVTGAEKRGYRLTSMCSRSPGHGHS